MSDFLRDGPTTGRGLRPVRIALTRAALLAWFLMWPAASYAITIISADGPGPPNVVPDNPTGFFIGTTPSTGEKQYFAVAWTQSQTYTDVVITALLSGSYRGDAHLTTTLGPGTTTAQQVASGSFMLDLDADERSDIQLLSGLSLGPGTYFLTLEPAAGSGGSWWNEKNQAFVLDDGVSFQGLYRTVSPGVDATFVPASDFALFFADQSFTFAVTGNIVAVPEPESGLLVAGALAALGWLGWRRKRSARSARTG